MTDFFWKRTHCPLVATIIGASIYSKLIQFYKGNSEGWAWTDTTFLENAKQKWQDQANEVSDKNKLKYRISEYKHEFYLNTVEQELNEVV